MEATKELIKQQTEAAKNPNHPINDGLHAHFAEQKRKLDEIKKSQSK